MSTQFDVIVIGSGFGGAVNACRAAQGGSSVLVLERGRRWTAETYPRGPHAPWLYDNGHPVQKNGWLDVRVFKGMAVAQGAGVGGGSLCYSSVVLEPDDACFGAPWPPEITHAELAPSYQKAREMLAVRRIPRNQRTPRTRLLQEGATALGMSSHFDDAPLAVSFDENYSPNHAGAIDPKATTAFINRQGQWQGTCVHLGNCDIGCDVRAKNTLDLNYLASAEQSGAQIRPLHLVRSIAPEGLGYRVHFDRVESGETVPGSEWGRNVILAAGSLGSTEILLRSRDQYRSLPNLSAFLGRNWSANGNFLTPAIYKQPGKVEQGIGPTISSVLDLHNVTVDGQRIAIEDDGFPNLWLQALRSVGFLQRWLPLQTALLGRMGRGPNEKNPLQHVMIWLGAGKDAGDGRLKLRANWFSPKSQKLSLDWNTRNSRPAIEAILKLHRQLTDATGGTLKVPLFWKLFGWLITVHPLGGCAMGVTRETGVVDHRGEVFGYPGLFVSDGSVFPAPIGLNPSLTIAALAERTSQFIR